MKFNLEQSIEILERTPAVLKTLLAGISEDWILHNEGPETFSPFDVVGHLIEGEKTDWMVRAEQILTSGTEKPFPVFDRFAQFEASKGKTISALLDEFTVLRDNNLLKLRALKLNPGDLDREGIHPVLGTVTLKNLLATWVVHDLTHIAQVTRVMAKQYTGELGPWPEFFRILKF